MTITLSTLRKSLSEKTLTAAEKKKREEVAKAIERENPGMPMAKKMAIATATAKKVAEGMDENLAADFLKMAHSKGFANARLTTTAQKKKETEDMLKKREAERKNKPARPVEPTQDKYPLGGYDPVSHRSYSEEAELGEAEIIVTSKKMTGEPPKGTYAYERKYGKFTAKGDLRKKPNPNKPPVDKTA